jgi:hypothetical protein
MRRTAEAALFCLAMQSRASLDIAAWSVSPGGGK